MYIHWLLLPGPCRRRRRRGSSRPPGAPGGRDFNTNNNKGNSTLKLIRITKRMNITNNHHKLQVPLADGICTSNAKLFLMVSHLGFLPPARALYKNTVLFKQIIENRVPENKGNKSTLFGPAESIRPVSLLRFSLLRSIDSNFSVNLAGWKVTHHRIVFLLVCKPAWLLRKEGGRVLLTEILLPRIARQGTVCLISIRGSARKARIEKFELDEGFQPYHPPFRAMYGQFPC